MEPEEYNRLKRQFSRLSDEVLLDYLSRGSEEFRPEAYDLIRAEAALRGLKAPSPSHDLPPSTVSDVPRSVDPYGKVTILEKFEDPFLLQQVMAALEEEGIVAFTKELDPAIIGAVGTYPAPLKIPLFVHERDEARAREILESFYPVEDAEWAEEEDPQD
ncbi:MAG TPA: DUF2007 domain-containing protein [Thermoanaerobaculia bacterium]|nr:DUF2007 domain-containing protein [Thermoanaerobaculia bacterium]HUM29817.1 DUF2007 domain-containing protein [Thermoanaerobaculia bacterium]HXK68092.1 DUF2007 domain-containing protein [Thermoanaerobaculia bacterium]